MPAPSETSLAAERQREYRERGKLATRWASAFVPSDLIEKLIEGGLLPENGATDKKSLGAALVEATRRLLERRYGIAMRTISAEMRRVVDIPDLPSLQQHASDLGREKHLRPKIGRMQRTKAWHDLGDLKRELLDLWTEERNTYAKEVLMDIETQRREAK